MSDLIPVRLKRTGVLLETALLQPRDALPLRSRILLVAVALGSALAIAVTHEGESDAGRVTNSARQDASDAVIGPAATADPAVDEVVLARGDLDAPVEAQDRHPVLRADETPSVSRAVPEQERAYDSLPRTAKEQRAAWSAAVEARFNETLDDRWAVERNYALVGKHISQRFQDTEMELVLHCSAVLCFIDISGGIERHRQFGEAFRSGWPVDGFEHTLFILAPDDEGISRALMFRDGQYVTMTGEIIDVPGPPGPP